MDTPPSIRSMSPVDILGLLSYIGQQTGLFNGTSVVECTESVFPRIEHIPTNELEKEISLSKRKVEEGERALQQRNALVQKAKKIELDIGDSAPSGLQVMPQDAYIAWINAFSIGATHEAKPCLVRLADRLVAEDKKTDSTCKFIQIKLLELKSAGFQICDLYLNFCNSIIKHHIDYNYTIAAQVLLEILVDLILIPENVNKTEAAKLYHKMIESDITYIKDNTKIHAAAHLQSIYGASSLENKQNLVQLFKINVNSQKFAFLFTEQRHTFLLDVLLKKAETSSEAIEPLWNLVNEVQLRKSLERGDAVSNWVIPVLNRLENQGADTKDTLYKYARITLGSHYAKKNAQDLILALSKLIYSQYEVRRNEDHVIILLLKAEKAEVDGAKELKEDLSNPGKYPAVFEWIANWAFEQMNTSPKDAFLEKLLTVDFLQNRYKENKDIRALNLLTDKASQDNKNGLDALEVLFSLNKPVNTPDREVDIHRQSVILKMSVEKLQDAYELLKDNYILETLIQKAQQEILPGTPEINRLEKSKALEALIHLSLHSKKLSPSERFNVYSAISEKDLGITTKISTIRSEIEEERKRVGEMELKRTLAEQESWKREDGVPDSNQSKTEGQEILDEPENSDDTGMQETNRLPRQQGSKSKTGGSIRRNFSNLLWGSNKV